MDAPVIFDNVCFGYDEMEILHHVSFQVNAGDFIGIIGPNGGGKTTLLKLILGFLKPSSGKIQVFGTSPQNARQQFAYVPQKLDFDKQFPISVLETVLMGRLSHLSWYGKYQQADINAAIRALERVGLQDHAKAQFGSLSSGQAQRVLIARALVSQPELILLDEPTASVDVQSETNIRNILQSLKGELTIMMVTHNLKTIIEDVQKILCIERNVMFLEPEEVCKHYSFGLYHPPLVNPKHPKSP